MHKRAPFVLVSDSYSVCLSMKNKASAQHAGDHYDARKEVGRAMWLWKHLYRSDMLWYSMGVIIRVVWTVVYPQQGYIHPVREHMLGERKLSDLFV